MNIKQYPAMRLMTNELTNLQFVGISIVLKHKPLHSNSQINRVAIESIPLIDPESLSEHYTC